MNRLRMLAAMLLAFWAVFAASAGGGEEEFARGYEAFVAGKYSEAVTWWHSAAKLGHARAQNGLGVLYRDGDGVAKDAKRAVLWFRRSAENGYAFGMFNLAAMYSEGTGVARDDIEAYKWFRIASVIDYDRKAAFERDIVAKRLTAEQLAQAEQRAQDWINRFFFGEPTKAGR